MDLEPYDIISVLTVDDHSLLREGIASVLSRASGFRLVGEASDARAAIDEWRRLKPDVTLMDIQLPGGDGIEVISTIRTEFPAARFLVVTTYRGDAQAMRALRAGASGYVLKSGLRRELLDAIRIVHAGRRYLSAEVSNELALHVVGDALTAREVSVLEQCALGRSNRLIGEALAIGEETVKAHMKSILAKLSAADRTQAVAIAMKRGILSI